VGQKHVVRTEERRGALSILAGKPDGKRPLEKPMCRRDDNIETDVQEIRWRGRRIDLAQDRENWRDLATTVKNLRVAQNAAKFLTNQGIVSCSRRALFH
jgi:hypothetical protein